ncbi:hypothetical protein K4749_39215 [Streptomyces sp. TRM72054]|uniref:hypothetical protein n=1 Tax=Streptomyces sp. TRM72054 TaxID=2870562 RepID=UPI001C8C628A|nr:hypothetical protein [Streptomyces sp. TRM72054]MBX9399416.1 hypothetical protein [Streptomyces sp. TRM72054]
MFKEAWNETSRAQATTLIPNRLDVAFAPDPDVDPFADDKDDPDRHHTLGVNIGVLDGLPGNQPGGHAHPGQDERGQVQYTRLLGIPGGEGVTERLTHPDKTVVPPTLASHEGRLYLAWKDEGNKLNLSFSDAGGTNFVGSKKFSESSYLSPFLVSHWRTAVPGVDGTREQQTQRGEGVFLGQHGWRLWDRETRR